MAATTIQIPSVEDVSGLIHDLLGLEVSPATGCAEGEHSVAEYKNDADETVAYMKCDLATGCRLGAALTQVPPQRAEEAVGESKLPDTLAENLDEIFNIIVNLIAAPDSERLRFAGVTHGDIPAEMTEKIQALDSHDYCFEVQKYGNCRLVISS